MNKSMNKYQRITFGPESRLLILSAFGKSVDQKGFIVETKTRKPVLTREGEEIEVKDLGGITKGSEIYLKSDIYSIIRFVELNG